MDLLTELLYSTARLEVTTPTGNSVGTGFFFFALQDEGNGVLLLVTNKHVVEGGSQLRFQLHLADKDGQPSGRSVACTTSLSLLFNHPDPEVDLCGIPVGPVLNAAEQQGTPVFYRTVGKEHFPEVDPSTKPRALEDILMIGYPNGLWDTVNNMPIVRRGITATQPSIRFEGRPDFMIDAACFPGSSGSPVFMFDRSALKPKPNVLIGQRFCFLGVLYAGPTIGPAGKSTVTPIPTTSSGKATEMMHLGFVVQAAEVTRLEDEVRAYLKTAQLDDAAGDASHRS